MNNQKNSDEIIRALRKDCSECSERSWCDHGTNAIGYYCPSMDAVDLLESQKVRIGELEAQLAESQRRERAAVEDMVYAIFNLEECVVCKNPCNKERPKDGGRFEPLYKQGCGGTWICGNFEWRGPQEAGNGGAE